MGGFTGFIILIRTENLRNRGRSLSVVGAWLGFCFTEPELVRGQSIQSPGCSTDFLDAPCSSFAVGQGRPVSSEEIHC